MFQVLKYMFHIYIYEIYVSGTDRIQHFFHLKVFAKNPNTTE